MYHRKFNEKSQGEEVDELSRNVGLGNNGPVAYISDWPGMISVQCTLAKVQCGNNRVLEL